MCRTKQTAGSALALLLLVLCARPLAADVVVSQIYGGGCNSGAVLKLDFVELLNRGDLAVAVGGWSIQYASASAATWQLTPLSGTIQPGSYYLVQLGGGSGGTVDLPTADAVGTINMAAAAGKVALVAAATALSVPCPNDASIHDFVGYGTANCFEGAAPALGGTNLMSVLRTDSGCADTGDNAADFVTGTPNPRNQASTGHLCAPLASATPTASSSQTPTHSVAPTAASSATPTPASTATMLATETHSPSPSPSETPSASATHSPPATETPTPTESSTPAPTSTLTPVPSPSPTETPSATSTATETPTPTESSTVTPESTWTAAASATHSETPIPTPTETQIPTLSESPTSSAGYSATPTPTPPATVTPPSASICGNGVVEPGEQCDDGNEMDGDLCPRGCSYRLSGALVHGNHRLRMARGDGCQVEWYVVGRNLSRDAYGFVSSTQTCADQDPGCDFNTGENECRFFAVACLNNTDPSLPSCQAGGISRFEIVYPPLTRRAGLRAANRAMLDYALSHLVDPDDPHAGAVVTLPLPAERTDVCSQPFAVDVERRGAGAGVANLIVDTFSPSGRPRRRERSRLRLICTS